MKRGEGTDRRTLCKAMGAAGIGLGAIGSAAPADPAPGPRPGISFDNSHFYDAVGEFNVDAAKEACFALMQYHGYPVYEGMKDAIWLTDYGKGQFAKLGLAARMWMNHVEHRYMLADMFLLPNQMLAEHWHLEGEGNPAKLEGWLVRHGVSHIVGEGEPNLSKEVAIPKCHMDGKVLTEHEIIAGPGDFASLNRATAPHWQFAGPEGAIITEVANVNTDSAARFSDKALNDYFHGG